LELAHVYLRVNMLLFNYIRLVWPQGKVQISIQNGPIPGLLVRDNSGPQNWRV
jgi:hypothetical protein